MEPSACCFDKWKRLKSPLVPFDFGPQQLNGDSANAPHSCLVNLKVYLWQGWRSRRGLGGDWAPHF